MKSMTAEQLARRVGHMGQIAAIRRLVSDDGQGRGMRIIEVGNGALNFTVLPDRALDIGRASYKGTPLAWVSGNLEVAPAFYEIAGNEWLRTWGGGLMTGCGLTNVGGPCDGECGPHGLHGRLSHIPAENVNTGAGWNEQGQYCLKVSGQVRQSKVFGENLLLTRRIATTLSSGAITVSDKVENCGFRESPFMLLYHINLGWPLVSEDSELEAPPHQVEAQTSHAAAAIGEWARMSAPTPGFNEQVYYHTLPADNHGMATMRLRNRRLGLTLAVSYRTAELPWMIEWKMMGEGEYVLGLEPANCFPEDQEKIAQRGLLRRLAPGASCETLVKIEVTEE